MRTTIFALLLAISVPVGTVRATSVQDGIGIYFDNGGSITCLPDSAGYPIQSTAYVILENPSSASGVSGWEAALSWDPGLFVSLISISGQAINLGAYPEFHVGLGQPLPASQRTILATLSVFATGPGGLHLSAYSKPSLPTTDYPVYAEGDDPSQLHLLSFSYGAPGGPCAVIGALPCPPSNDEALTFVLESPYTELEFRSDGLYGFRRSTSTWEMLPRRSNFEHYTTEQVVRATASYTGLASDPAKGAKELTILQEDFENYNPTGANPLTRTSGPAQWLTTDFDTFRDLDFWDVTTTKSHSGTMSAHPAIWHESCYVYKQLYECDLEADSCTWARRTAIPVPYPTAMMSALWTAAPLTIDSGAAYALTYSIWQDFYNSDTSKPTDLLLVEIEAYRDCTYKYLTVAHSLSTKRWDSAILRLPCESVQNDSINLVFTVQTGIYAGTTQSGVFLDDVAIVKRDTDLAIQSITILNAPDVSVPISIDIVIQNSGADASGPCTLGLVQNRELPDDVTSDFVYDQYYSIPSIAPYGHYTIHAQVTYSMGKALSDKSIIATQQLHCRVDCRDTWPENFENNNTGDAAATWTMANPAVLLIHGLMGGKLAKTNGLGWVATTVWGDASTCIDTAREPGRIARTFDPITGDGVEADNTLGNYMWAPGAYGPEAFGDNLGGFMRELRASVSLNAGQWLGSCYHATLPPLTWYGAFPEITVTVGPRWWDELIVTLNNKGIPLHNDYYGGLYLFNYDWRLDFNPDVAGARQPSAVVKLDSLITYIAANDSGGGNLVVVTHSAGGLVMQAYLLRQQELGRPSNVAKWIALGVPFQGSMKAMAGLFGATPIVDNLVTKYAGRGWSRTVQDWAEEFIGLWECLPTPTYDIGSPRYWDWQGSGVYADYGAQVFPFTRIRLPIPDTSIEGLGVWEPLWRGTGMYANDDWHSNAYSRASWSTFTNRFVTTPARTINNVPVIKLVATPNVATLVGVVKYDEPSIPFADNGITTPESELLYTRKYDVAFGGGDGFVSTYSATGLYCGSAVNVQNMYVDGVAHEELIRNSDVAAYVASVVMNEPNPSWAVTDNEDAFANSTEYGWHLEWKTDAALWLPDKSKAVTTYEALPANAVALELIDMTNNVMLYGLGQVVGASYDESPVVGCYEYDDRFDVLHFGQQTVLCSAVQDPMSLRLVIRPDPDLWCPWCPDAADPAKTVSRIANDAQLAIRGRLIIAEQNGDYWAFPGLENEDELIAFNSLGRDGVYEGFQAYIDFEVVNGNVVGDDLRLHVDPDGDGVADMIVTGVLESGSRGAVADNVKVFPNPMNAQAEVRWMLGHEKSVACIQIHDARGRRVREMATGGGAEGFVRWDGCDDRGASVGSGTYIVTVRAATGACLGQTRVTVVK